MFSFRHWSLILLFNLTKISANANIPRNYFVLFLCFFLQRSRSDKGKEKESTSQSGRVPPMSLVSQLVPSNIHPILQFTPRMSLKYNAWNDVLMKIKDKDIVYPRQIDWQPLEQAGIAANLRKTLSQTVKSRHDGYTYDVDDWERF